jgi:hypothetical protein
VVFCLTTVTHCLYVLFSVKCDFMMLAFRSKGRMLEKVNSSPWTMWENVGISQGEYMTSLRAVIGGTLSDRRLWPLVTQPNKRDGSHPKELTFWGIADTHLLLRSDLARALEWWEGHHHPYFHTDIGIFLLARKGTLGDLYFDYRWRTTLKITVSH